MTLIYLASPYSHENKVVMSHRVRQVQTFVAQWVVYGRKETLFSPIAYYAPMEEYGIHTELEACKPQDEKWLDMCDEIWVLLLPGWEVSEGVEWEMQYALENDVPLKFVYPASGFGLPVPTENYPEAAVPF